MSTYLQMQDEVLAYGFDIGVYRNRVKVWLNDAQSEIARRIEIPELFTGQATVTVPGTQAYTLNIDIVRIDFVFMYNRPSPTSAERMALTPSTYKDVITYTAEANRGFPEVYALDSASIIFAPIPDAAYNFTVGYYKRPVDLVADSDVSSLTGDYHKAIIRYAVAEAYMAEDDNEMHNYHMGRFEKTLMDMRTDRQAEIDDGPVQIGGTWSN